jgi:predicted dehydrogenase
MQNKSADEMSDFMIDQLVHFFGKKVSDFEVSDVIDNQSHKTFTTACTAYDYFPVILTYEKGRFGCSIVFGKRTIGLNSSQKWWDEADFAVFLKEMQEELELRIPDKFLKSHGWL